MLSTVGITSTAAILAWQLSSIGLACAIITTRPNVLMAPIHDRMPAVVQPEHHAVWLDPTVENAQRPQGVLVLTLLWLRRMSLAYHAAMLGIQHRGRFPADTAILPIRETPHRDPDYTSSFQPPECPLLTFLEKDISLDRFGHV